MHPELGNQLFNLRVGNDNVHVLLCNGKIYNCSSVANCLETKQRSLKQSKATKKWRHWISVCTALSFKLRILHIQHVFMENCHNAIAIIIGTLCNIVISITLVLMRPIVIQLWPSKLVQFICCCTRKDTYIAVTVQRIRHQKCFRLQLYLFRWWLLPCYTSCFLKENNIPDSYLQVLKIRIAFHFHAANVNDERDSKHIFVWRSKGLAINRKRPFPQPYAIHRTWRMGEEVWSYFHIKSGWCQVRKS